MTDLPRKGLARTARLASLPIGIGTRAAVGLGKRIGGRPAEAVTKAMQEQTAAQLFAVLGELKGGAMKVGQGMSVFEAALPEELAAPYREMLTKLQEAAPAMPVSTVHQVLREELGARWRSRFTAFDDTPVAAASIGQVHRATWKDGRQVAVKVQYPGAAQALMSDLKQIGFALRLTTSWVPGLDLGPILTEVTARLGEETDYLSESAMQAQFAQALAGSEYAVAPEVVTATDRVLVSEWIEGIPLSRVIASGSQEERDLATERYAQFLLGGPRIAGLLHADPHPGNFRLLPDGRLGVLDFGAVNRLPDGLPPGVRQIADAVLTEDGDELVAVMREAGFIKRGMRVDGDALVEYLGVFVKPLREAEFTFSRDWLRSVFAKVSDPRAKNFGMSMRLNLPPDYVLIHRAWLGGVAVLCQLEGTAPVRAIFDEATG